MTEVKAAFAEGASGASGAVTRARFDAVLFDLDGVLTSDSDSSSDAWIWAIGVAFLAAVFIGTRYRRAPQ